MFRPLFIFGFVSSGLCLPFIEVFTIEQVHLVCIFVHRKKSIFLNELD